MPMRFRTRGSQTRYSLYWIFAVASVTFALTWVLFVLSTLDSGIVSLPQPDSPPSDLLPGNCKSCSGSTSRSRSGTERDTGILHIKAVDTRLHTKTLDSGNDFTAQTKVKVNISPLCSDLNYAWEVQDQYDLEVSCDKAIFLPGQRPGDLNINYLKMDGPRGRLGNQLFQLSSLLGIAHAQKRAVCVSSHYHLLQNFNLSVVEEVDWHHSQTWLRVTEKSWATLDSCLLNLPRANVTITESYLQSYKYFHGISHKIRDYMYSVFHRFTLNEAIDLLNSLWHPGLYPRNTTAFVGVHVRRTDMLWRSSQDAGYTAPSKGYYLRAIRWMRDLFPSKNVKFVVVSEDFAWCDYHLSRSFVKVAPPASAEVHLALLASCDHVIVSTGTFGWWGAWLSGGKVVYYKDFPAENSRLARGFNKSDYFLPTWVGLS